MNDSVKTIDNRISLKDAMIVFKSDPITFKVNYTWIADQLMDRLGPEASIIEVMDVLLELDKEQNSG